MPETAVCRTLEPLRPSQGLGFHTQDLILPRLAASDCNRQSSRDLQNRHQNQQTGRHYGLVQMACARLTSYSSGIQDLQTPACPCARAYPRSSDGVKANTRDVAVRVAPADLSRRALQFQALGGALLADIAKPDNDAKTLVNSILGMLQTFCTYQTLSIGAVSL